MQNQVIRFKCQHRAAAPASSACIMQVGAGFSEAERKKLACAAMNYNLDVIKDKEALTRSTRPATSGPWARV